MIAALVPRSGLRYTGSMNGRTMKMLGVNTLGVDTLGVKTLGAALLLWPLLPL